MAWRQPHVLTAEVGTDGIALRVPSEVSLYAILKRILKRSLKKYNGSKVYFLHIDYEDECAVFGYSSVSIQDGEYLPANYDPMYYIMDVTNLQKDKSGVIKAAGNSETWSKIENYHEHLSFNAQDVQAHFASQLLVAKIRELIESPKSILELGCGSGRNLWHMGHAFPNAKCLGIDINPAGTQSNESPSNVSITQGDILKLDWNLLGDFDVIFTSGFLMHINHRDVEPIFESINLHSTLQLHFELHGPSYVWDYHRYPRSYNELMQHLKIPILEYSIFADNPILSYKLTPSFAHALLVTSAKYEK